MTTGELLTQFEKEKLDILKWYAVIKQLSESDITLFFQRLRDCQCRKISSGTTDEEVIEIRNTIKGIAATQLFFNQIHKETKENNS